MLKLFIYILIASFSSLAHSNYFLKNTTEQTLTLFGHDIQSGTYYLIPERELRGFATHQGILDAVANGDLLISTDGTLEGEIASPTDGRLYLTSYSLPQNTWFKADGFVSDNVRDAILEARDAPPIASIGGIFSHCFSKHGNAGDKWIGNISGHIPSNQTPQPILWDADIVGITFSNKVAAAKLYVEVWRSAMGAETVKDRILRWDLTEGARVASDNTLLKSINGGDKLSIFLDSAGKKPQNVSICLYLKIRTANPFNYSESWSKDYKGGGN